MKTKRLQSVMLSAIGIFFTLFFFQCSSSKKSADLDTGDVKNMIDNKAFVFVAERVTPLRGRTRHLTSEYDVRINRDSLVSYLPYFGRAYQAPMNPSEGGIQFTSTNFSYDVNTGNNKEWGIEIKPKDRPDIQQLSFSIFENGSATLNVASTYKDPISFSGTVQKIK